MTHIDLSRRQAAAPKLCAVKGYYAEGPHLVRKVATGKIVPISRIGSVKLHGTWYYVDELLTAQRERRDAVPAPELVYTFTGKGRKL